MDPMTPGDPAPKPPKPPKVYVKHKIDAIQKALKLAQRLGDRDTFNWSEILRASEEILKNAPKDEASQEQARKRYLENLASMNPDDLPPALRPVIGAAKAVLVGDK